MTSSFQQRPPATIVFIFGGSGDLNFRKLTPALYNLYIDKYLPERFAVVGLGRSEYTNETFRERLFDGIQKFSRRKDGPWSEFSTAISYLQLDAGDAASFSKITDVVNARHAEWGQAPNVLFYLSVAPKLVPEIATNLSKLDFCRDTIHTRIVVEKPFGHDLASATELNRLLGGLFAEEQIYRIDHYLGKETVQNILALRFANALFEPIFNKNYVEHIQITASETVGLEGRAGYYEGSGALRDMIQNHLLQLMCMVAMEAPVAFGANEVRNKKVDVLNAIRRIPADKVAGFAVRGQYGPAADIKGKPVLGYREEKNIPADSKTETYAALKLYVDNWRWQNVPFYLRTGKFLPEKITEITIRFKPAPNFAFPQEATDTWRQNRLIIGIAPVMDIRLRFQTKRPGQIVRLDPVDMAFRYADSYDGQEPEAYETLLLDVMTGDATLFMRADQVEAAWRVVQPVLDAWEAETPDFPNYMPNTWGPEAANQLIEKEGYRWMKK